MTPDSDAQAPDRSTAKVPWRAIDRSTTTVAKPLRFTKLPAQLDAIGCGGSIKLG